MSRIDRSKLLKDLRRQESEYRGEAQMLLGQERTLAQAKELAVLRIINKIYEGSYLEDQDHEATPAPRRIAGSVSGN